MGEGVPEELATSAGHDPSMGEDDAVEVPTEDAFQRGADGAAVPHAERERPGCGEAVADSGGRGDEPGGPGATGRQVEPEIGQDAGAAGEMEEVDFVVQGAAAEGGLLQGARPVRLGSVLEDTLRGDPG